MTYVYAVALHSGGRHEEATTVFNETLCNRLATFQAFASFSRMAGDAVAALAGPGSGETGCGGSTGCGLTAVLKYRPRYLPPPCE